MTTYVNSSNLKLETLFQVMKKRIAKGFKDSDLSFLIGKPHATRAHSLLLAFKSLEPCIN